MLGPLQCVVLDCEKPRELAEFYRVLFGGEVNRPDRRWGLDDDWATLHLETGMVLAFQGVPEYQRPTWPDTVRPQQFHLDVGVSDLDAAEQEVLAHGATVLDDGDGKRSWRIYADPAGHPFCLVKE